MKSITLFTLGFTKKSAEAFFGLLKNSGAKRVVDIRLNNASQLAGFTKKEDLAFFLKALCGMDYHHLPELAPTKEILDGFRKTKDGWKAYEKKFIQLLSGRGIEESLSRELLDGACLLCSEDTPEHCHRRLVAEYLKDRWGNVEIVHL